MLARFAVSAAMAIVLMALASPAQALGETTPKTAVVEELTDATSVFADTDPRLVEIYNECSPRLIAAYKMNEGGAFAGSYGAYVVGLTDDDKIVWLVNSTVDYGLQVNLLEVVCVMSLEEWAQAMREAKKLDQPYPSPRTFRPENYVQSLGKGKPLKGHVYCKDEK